MNIEQIDDLNESFFKDLVKSNNYITDKKLTVIKIHFLQLLTPKAF